MVIVVIMKNNCTISIIDVVCVCSVEDVFEWIFEVVDSDNVRDDTGRLAFTIEYELASAGALRGHVENKVATRVQIQPDTTFAIVPVVKVSFPLISSELYTNCCEWDRYMQTHK